LDSTHDSSNWIIDSGATNHVTNEINNLSSFFAYKGPDNLHIGNGIGLDILHIGSQSFIISNLSLKLTNVLHVPNFSTNLISLSQLLIDNPSLSINFSSSSCVIKDLHTKNLPIKISNLNGLYTLKMKSTSSLPQAFLGTRTTTRTWHARLGHPSTTTTIKVINNNFLPCIRENFTFCGDCVQAKAHVLPFSPSTSSSISPLQLVHSDV
jgi:Reverse transcriptase (RNA-dependent DNA polymerase)/GAG-pre-integrase domain